MNKKQLENIITEIAKDIDKKISFEIKRNNEKIFLTFIIFTILNIIIINS